MKRRQLIFTPVALSVLAAVLAVITWVGSAPANAATTTSSARVSLSGTVSGDAGSFTGDSTTESVSFSGSAQVTARVVDDPDFGTTPIIVLSIDLSGVAGSGTSGTKYVTDNQSIIQRRLASSDALQFTFPFWPSGTTGITTSRVGSVSLSLSFDVAKKTLTGATGSITSP